MKDEFDDDRFVVYLLLGAMVAGFFVMLVM